MSGSTFPLRRLLVSCIAWAPLVLAPAARCATPPAHGPDDPGELKALGVETGRTTNGEFLLDGPDAAQ
jgi:hypothetical protein